MGYTVPTAIAVLVAKAVADAIEQEGIYDLVIQMNEFPYLNAKKQHIFGQHSVADVVDSILPVLQVDESHTVSRLKANVEDLLALGNIDGSLPCCFTYEVDDELALGVLGLISVNDLKHAMGEAKRDTRRPTYSDVSSRQKCCRSSQRHSATSCLKTAAWTIVLLGHRYTASGLTSTRIHTISFRSSIR